MSQITKILSVARVTRNDSKITDVTIDPGGGANKTAEDFRPAGDDAHPLTTDFALASATQRSGGEAVIGYLDPVNEPKAQPGDKRIYGRDVESGAQVCEVWLKNDGSVLVSNENGSVLLRSDGGTLVTTPESTFDAKADGSIKGANGSGQFELQTGGDFVVNGVTIDTGGNITTPAAVNADSVAATTSSTAAGLELAGHTHLAGTPPGSTGPNQ